MASADLRDPMYGGTFVPTADVQTLTISGSPTGGTYTLTFQGQTTTALAFNADNAAIQAALRALSTIGAGNVTVTGTGPFIITFSGSMASGYYDLITAVAALTGGTTPDATVVHTTPGTPSLQVDPRGGSQTVLDMYRNVSVRITTSTSDNHYTPDGDLYHE